MFTSIFDNITCVRETTMLETVKNPVYVIPQLLYLLSKVGMICVFVNTDFCISLFLFFVC